LIKAKKVKLEGFKVVGKIDLPEKVKKEDPAAESTDGEEKVIKKPERPNRKFDRDRKKNKGATLRNTLSYEERMKREEREKLRQRKKKEREAKLRNKKLYEETIQSKVSKTPKKKSGKKKFLAGQEKSEVKIHKNPIKRLRAWLNGQYDKF
jgi:hypothetical protein